MFVAFVSGSWISRVGLARLQLAIRTSRFVSNLVIEFGLKRSD